VIKYTGGEFKMPAALTNKKQENIEKIHASNIDRRCGVALTARKTRLFFPEIEASKTEK
jgi:hypothetical protein